MKKIHPKNNDPILRLRCQVYLSMLPEESCSQFLLTGLWWPTIGHSVGGVLELNIKLRNYTRKFADSKLKNTQGVSVSLMISY